MPFISKIKLSVMSYVTEDVEIVKKSMLYCLPEELRDIKIKRQNLQSQFRDKLIILSVDIHKKQELKLALPYLSENIINKEYFDFEDNLDMLEKSLHLRIDKFKTLDEIIELTTGSDVIKCEISYTTYSKGENEFDQISKIYRDAGLIA